jgi:uncharacterized membrane protein
VSSEAYSPANRISTYLDRPATAAPVNVGETERLASVVGGGALALAGLARGGLGGLALAVLGGSLLYRGSTGHCHLYGALGQSTAEKRNPNAAIPAGHGVRVDESVTIDKPAAELYRRWRDFANLAQLLSNLESVTDLGGGRSRWVAKGPMGHRATWDAEIITERDNELIGWKSVEGSEVATAGSVHFRPAPGGRGTELRVELKYEPPAGKLGAAAAWLFGDSAGQQVRDDLRRFKRVMETGTVPTTEGQARGTC